MQKNRGFSSILLSAVLFLFLGITAYFQLSWAMDLQQLEQQRLQTGLAKNIVELGAYIRQELYLLPTLVMTNETALDDVEKNAAGAIRFWQMHATESTLFSDIYLYFPSYETPFKVWKNDFFAPADKKEYQNLQEYTSLFMERRRDFASSLLISLPNSKILFMNQITSGKRGEQCYILCIVDYRVLTEQLIPKLVGNVFDEGEAYNYRLYNTQIGKTLYLSDPYTTAQTFAFPDFTLPLLPFSDLGYNIPLHPLSVEKIPFTPDFYNFVKNRMRIFSRELPLDLSIYDSPKNVLGGVGKDLLPVHNALVLEFVHKDGSLFKASVKVTAQNIVTSLLVLIILATGVLVLVINTQRAQNLARRQQEFISTITHELKTPLAVISSAAQNLSDGIINDPDKIRRYGHIIQKEDVRLHSTIEYFLLYSNLNTSARLIRKETDIIPLIETALSRTEQLLIENGFTVEKSFPRDPVFVFCDSTAILSVVQNLITNAVKHAKSGRYLGISLALDGSSGGRNLRKNAKQNVILRVCDHGKGIPKREQKTVFDPFSRGREAVDMQIEGSGIGLNLAKRIVVMHGGSICVEVSNLQGSIFKVTLPLAEKNT